MKQKIDNISNKTKAIFAKYKTNGFDKKARALLAAGLAVILLLIGVVAVLSNKPLSKQIVVAQGFEADLPPEGFFGMRKREKVVVPPSPVRYRPENLFKRIKPKIDPEKVRKAEALAEFNQRIKSHRSLNAFVINYDEGDETDYQIKNIAQIRNMDEDFSAHRVPTTVTTRPVDLSRTLPMTEIIPVILIDEIKSELPGEVVRARVPQDVYSYHGRKILIPSGSTAIGRYESLSKVGDTRLAIAFYRIITPEGININLSGFAADNEGSEGLTGDLDNKNMEKFGIAGIAGVIQAATQLSVSVNNQNQKAAADSIAQPMNEVIAQVISESINIAPTLRIHKGTPFNIKFASDIWFPKPVNNVIETIPLG